MSYSYLNVSKGTLKMNKNQFPNESEIIIRHTQTWLLTSNESVKSLALDMLAPRLKKFAPENPTVAEQENWEASVSRMVHRYLKGTHPMPLSWKWQWLDCLPNKYRDSALKEIHAVHGFLDTLPEIENGTVCDASINEVLESVASMVSTAEPAHDGKYDERDSIESSNQMIDSLLGLAAKCLDEARKINAGTGAVGTRHNIHNFSMSEAE